MLIREGVLLHLPCYRSKFDQQHASMSGGGGKLNFNFKLCQSFFHDYVDILILDEPSYEVTRNNISSSCIPRKIGQILNGRAINSLAIMISAILLVVFCTVSSSRMDIDREALEEWQKNQPLCILSLDPADRAVLRVAGRITKKHK